MFRVRNHDNSLAHKSTAGCLSYNLSGNTRAPLDISLLCALAHSMITRSIVIAFPSFLQARS